MGIGSWIGKALAKRAAPYIPDLIPEKVFVTQDGHRYNEYTTEYPAHLSPGMGDMLERRIQELLYGYYGDQNFINLFYCLPEVYAPVHEIASRVAECNWQLRKIRKTGAVHDDEVIYTDRDFNRLFTNPNPLMNMKEFVYQMVCYELLTGKSFEYFNKPDSLPNEYSSILTRWNLPAQNVRIDVKQYADTYSATDISDLVNRYYLADGENREFAPAKVLSNLNYSLYYGNRLTETRSPLMGAEKAIRNLIPVYEARGIIYIKRGALGFVVSRKGDESGLTALTKQEKQDVQNEFNQSYGLSRDKSPIGVVAAPVDFVQVGMSIQDLQPFDETLADACAIYAALRVPPHLIPSKDKSTFNNANTDLKAFYTDVIIPYAQNMAERWTNYFKMEESRRYIHADFSHLDILQEDKKQKAEVDKTNGAVYLQRWQSGVASLNDWLTSFGAEEINEPLYQKKLFQYTPEELELAKTFINLKTISTDPAKDEAKTQE